MNVMTLRRKNSFVVGGDLIDALHKLS